MSRPGYRRKRRLRSLGAALTCLGLLLLTGCLEYDEMIFMNPDGSGQIRIHYQAEKDMKFEQLYFPTDSYEVRENIRSNYRGEGIVNTHQSLRYKEKMTHVYMDFDFDQLDTLNDLPRFQNERFETQRNQNSVTLKRFLHLDESKLDRTKLLLKSGLRGLFSRNVLSEIRFRFQWIVPGTILASNATVIGDRNRAIWSITLEEILQDRSVEFFLEYAPPPGASVPAPNMQD